LPEGGGCADYVVGWGGVGGGGDGGGGGGGGVVGSARLMAQVAAPGRRSGKLHE
jgi:hypothetical protein